jgi:choline kinase
VTTTDVAVILVAGIGQRLRPLTDDRPKALMDLGGETILARAIRLLAAAGVGEIVLATGYREDQIRRHVEHLPVKTLFVPNPDYEQTQNSVSLWCCRAAVVGRAFFKLDGDVVFQPAVLERLARSSAELAVAVDRGRDLDQEAMKVHIHEERILAFGKALEPVNAHAETIGIERLDRAAGERVFEAIEGEIARGRRDRYYEDVYSALVAAGRLDASAVDVSDVPWAEVDTLSDLEHARALVTTG